METGELAIEIPKPGRHTGDFGTEPIQLFRTLDGRTEERIDRGEPVADAAFGHRKDRLLGPIQYLADRLVHRRGKAAEVTADP